MKKENVIFLLFVAVLTGCASLQQDVLYTTDKKDFSVVELSKIEEELTAQRIEKNKASLAAIQRDLDKIISIPSSDAPFIARSYALYADLLLLKNERSAAIKKLRLATSNDPYDEYVQLVTARALRNLSEKKNYLENLTEKDATAYRLRAELGDTYYHLKEYVDALVAFDASLPFLPKQYTNLYKEKRDFCLGRRFTKDYTGSESYLEATELSLLGMTAITQENSSGLHYITGTARWKVTVLAERLQQAGWYAPEIDFSQNTTRKDAALFLWHFLNGNDTRNLNRYSRIYEKRQTSPIPDLPFESPFFDAILGSVEEDIIPLVDGRNFNPGGKVSGSEFYHWLLKTDQLK
ncbi:hypothetical protein DWQ65_11400 [Treponema phagedenis]|uniref:Tetratricopeptide repeat protein n=1 Tax=Treponema phagedenis TaxID=162 RepID=A0A0B7GWY1_TREPH|nr:hypothetical protein [Treponema phagedenis]QEJ96092.1 hypothetical protein FUT79_13355 [Treponema phagedenis]QEJ97246.1 hypothetical protein FUT82_04095 [Treponema phagedenis]QEK02561.1 hypothetical protein FUT83_01230 [Treponema phagedenis]QEK08189.1 hypothetical protein FUT81_01220 [Treponema phagedenis]QSI00653.1 hypothetical protein DWQ65_11400 [Treponema phagedenis]